MEAAAVGGAYADARFVCQRHEYVATRNGAIDELHNDEDEGIGVRARVGGAWGFAATRDTSKAGAEAALARALAIARAQPRAEETPLAPEPVARGKHRGGEGTDPFGIPLERKLDRLMETDAALGSDKRINLRQVHFGGYARDTIFASTDGALYEQASSSLAVVCPRPRSAATRSRSLVPGSYRGDTLQAGYEHFAAIPLVAEAPRVAERR